jgi:hypothetical protein
VKQLELNDKRSDGKLQYLTSEELTHSIEFNVHFLSDSLSFSTIHHLRVRPNLHKLR